jgi:hypothetical protein
MADKTLDVTEQVDAEQKLILLKDNGGGTHSVSVNVGASALPSGGATSANQALELTELRSINPLSSIVFDSILITYTDITKTVISKVEWKLGANVVKTLTPTFGVQTDSWAKS